MSSGYALFTLHYLLRLKQPSGTEIHRNSENSTCNPLKYTMGNPILIVSICMVCLFDSFFQSCRAKTSWVDQVLSRD